ncbi:DUF2634 domain-containing protein [Paenibacillus sp. TAB 01]|uniref:DUF2634 domain-containing protein n=1 Tax=Paenibacillus sp. TAB 01 TaxID=3368988 RepID=UPI0037503620
MAALPQIAQLDFPDNDLQSSTASTTVHRTFDWDFNTGDFKMMDGKLMAVTELSYLKIWVQKILLTVKDSGIYAGTQFGSEHDTIIGKNFNPAYSQAEFERMIREALLQNDAITRVDGFGFTMDGARLVISFEVSSIYGKTAEQVVV